MPVPEDPGAEDPLAQRIARQASRKLLARHRRNHGTWFGLGMYGMVGPDFDTA